MTRVAMAEFIKQAGRYLDDDSNTPVFITEDNAPAYVLLNVDEYNRLKACDTRRALYTHELGPEWRDALAAAKFDHLDPELDKLMD